MINCLLDSKNATYKTYLKHKNKKTKEKFANITFMNKICSLFI